MCPKLFYCHIWTTLIKIHIPVKEVQMKLIEGKISNTGQISCVDLHVYWKMLTSFFHSEVTRNIYIAHRGTCMAPFPFVFFKWKVPLSIKKTTIRPSLYKALLNFGTF